MPSATMAAARQSIGILIQFNLGRTKSDYYNPGSNNPLLRGMDRFWHSFQ